MKTVWLVLLGAFVGLQSAGNVQAQVYGAKRYVNRPNVPAQRPGRPMAPVPAATNAPAGPTAQHAPVPAVTPRYTQAVVRIIPPPPVDPEKARAAKELTIKKTVEFQKKRAEEGSESAQYELGVRYLKGEGVEKDEATGRKWLTLAAKNGYEPANRKLEDLDKPKPEKLDNADKTDK